MAYHVFVSYSTRDLQTVERVRQLLADATIQVFVAEHSVRPGQSLQGSISQAIANCDLFLLLWSEHSKGSDWVQQEVGAAKALGKVVLPVLLDPGLGVPALLSGIRY